MRSVVFFCAVFLLAIMLQLSLLSYSLPTKGNKCNMKLIIMHTVCHPLKPIWVMRGGKCIKGLQCAKGYTQEECVHYCIKGKPINQPSNEITNTESVEDTTSDSTRRTRWTRRTRTPKTTAGTESVEETTHDSTRRTRWSRRPKTTAETTGGEPVEETTTDSTRRTRWSRRPKTTAESIGAVPVEETTTDSTRRTRRTRRPKTTAETTESMVNVDTEATIGHPIHTDKKCNLKIILMYTICHPLKPIWVLRDGKCIKGMQCVKGYTQEECELNCIKGKPINEPSNEITNSESFEDTTSASTRRTRWTRRTRTPKTTAESRGAEPVEEPINDSTRRTRRTRRPKTTAETTESLVNLYTETFIRRRTRRTKRTTEALKE